MTAGGHDAPPSPHTRDPIGRAGRPGAPLWRVVDFADGVGDADRAGLEAALEASGILDAWVTPDGELRDRITDDTIVRPTGPAPGGGLAQLLVPAIDRADESAAALDDAAVATVLRSIGVGEGTTWVDVDGRFQVGVLAGSWHKDSAVYLGEGAREAARRARLAFLRSELDRLAELINELAAARRELDAMLDVLRQERKRLPADEPLREAHSALAAAHAAKRVIDQNLGAAAVRAKESADQAAVAERRADEFADDVSLPADRARLDDVRAATGEYRIALTGLWPAAQAAWRAAREVTEVEEEMATAEEKLAVAAEEAGEARERSLAADETLNVLIETAGAGVDDLYRKLNAAKAALEAAAATEKHARASESQALGDKGKAEGLRERLADEIQEATQERATAIDDLRAFTATGLLATALPDLDTPDPNTEWAAKPAVAVARAINAALEGLDDADRPWELIQQRVTAEHKLLTDALSRQGHSVGMTVRSGVIVVDVRFQGRTLDVPTLVDALAAETEQRATLLSAKEREILENHLINEVAGTLQELIAGAEQQVSGINADLEARPTSTGMRLRLLWKSAKSAPDGLDRVRDRLLRQTADAWSPADRALVGGFLQEQINREHSEDIGGGWADQLTRALDYRSWHEFAIQRFQDGQWRSASGPASGGERVLAASVPLFAAASSFYSSAGNPHAPRLIALDEAFAGVDDDSRAKCLGLLASFDLDVVMTSEREWGCYPEVPGLAISQLTRRDGIDAVLVTPWRWDGKQRSKLPRPGSGSITGSLFD
ncbi:TIGR02680 family protein [Alloactinosynnema sp. L-07]|uniref:TIGR02680 family protein n=1 Tax=Alloactinosynnema sp. L-07 TaxID=1653480 RepID=UPI001E63FEDC|nr:TIGR02680 family protein [Alloactinosynnema sp. L-07]